ncbi:MAG: DMT family transporter [Kiloniellales bacterium]|nr:DMT family transporter [Kiloniellales bacterium]
MSDQPRQFPSKYHASPAPEGRKLALFLLFCAPALFATNMLTARAVAADIPPVGLAFGRWTLTLLILLCFVGPVLLRERRVLLEELGQFLLLGALGMGVCGVFVYVAADTTTATNIGLIYSTSPIMIALIAWRFMGEPLSPVNFSGIALSLLGVLIIICRGNPHVIMSLSFAVGDIWILFSTLAWALYSILLKHWQSQLHLMARFAAITLGGVIVLLPFQIWEGLSVGWPQFDRRTLSAIALLAIVASFLAYQCYAYIQRHLGAGPTSLLMYLIPLYNGVLAYFILGEALQGYHLAGALLVLPGIFLATRRA